MVNTICIDARLWGIKHTGIGRYIENLIANLSPDNASRVVLVVPPQLQDEPKLKHFRKVYVRSHPYAILSQFEMLFALLKIRPDVLHVPHFTIPIFWPGKMIITIHDLIKHVSIGPETTTRSPALYKLKYWAYLLTVKIAVNRAKHIIVPALYWKKDLITRYHLPEKKISVVYEGVSEVFFQTPTNNSVFNPIKDPYIIYTGNLYPHKNIPVLLQAIKFLKGDIKLVIVCARSVFTNRIEKLISSMSLSSDVTFLNGISDNELVRLYKNSRAFVTPSLIEGFGLPGIEAMAVGTPVIAAKSSCLPEIYQNAAAYFDPHNANELSEIIKKIVNNEKIRQDMIHRGRLQAKTFSWQKMSQLTWKIYHDESL